jgi:hypothetical protein
LRRAGGPSPRIGNGYTSVRQGPLQQSGAGHASRANRPERAAALGAFYWFKKIIAVSVAAVRGVSYFVEVRRHVHVHASLVCSPNASS